MQSATIKKIDKLIVKLKMKTYTYLFIINFSCLEFLTKLFTPEKIVPELRIVFWDKIPKFVVAN